MSKDYVTESEALSLLNLPQWLFRALVGRGVFRSGADGKFATVMLRSATLGARYLPEIHKLKKEKARFEQDVEEQRAEIKRRDDERRQKENYERVQRENYMRG